MHHIFIDDSGKKEYINPYNRAFVDNPPVYSRYKNFWQNNYFVLTGVIIDKIDFPLLNKEINDIKLKYFNTTKIEIKSEWLRIKEQREKRYLKPFNLKVDDCFRFGEECINFIVNNKEKIKIISIVFDKRYYGEIKRATPDGNPLIMTCQVLFDRLKMLNCDYHLHFDQFESSLKLNKGSHKQINELYIGRIPIKRYTDDISHIIDIDFKSSATENFLQLADLASYNIYRQFVEFGREWEQYEHGAKLNLYPYFNKIKCNLIYKDGNSCGVGLIKLPETRRILWDLRSDCDDCKIN